MVSTHGYVAAEPELGLPDTGGQVVHVLELSKSLSRLGYEVDILTRQFEDQPEQEKVSDHVRVVRFPCGGREFIPKEFLWEKIPEWVRNAKPFLEKNRESYDFINSHYWDAGMAAQSLSKELDIPHVHTPHSIGAWKKKNMEGDPEELEQKYNFRRRIREEKAIYNGCDAVIATTPIQRDVLQDEPYDVPSEKIHLIPPGYDDTRFYPVSRAERQALKRELGYEGKQVVLALGRMARNKGYDLLLWAMPVVFERVKDAKLVLAAGSHEPDEDEKKQHKELKKLAKDLEIENRVDFRSYIPDEQLANYYRIADVFALPSRYEPFGMTAVEAMACGTPTVITTEGGLWQQVRWGVHALYANPYDFGTFGHMICVVLQLPQVAIQLGKYGPELARAKFTWIGIAQRLLRIHEDVSSADYA